MISYTRGIVIENTKKTYSMNIQKMKNTRINQNLCGQNK